MQGDFETIAHFLDPTAAHLARGILEANGIEAHVTGDITGNLEPMFSLFGGAAKGGIRLLVAAADAEEALSILNEEGLE